MQTVFTSRQATEITGITQRQLAYWRKSALLVPSHTTAGGHARYTFTDLIALKTAKQLLDTGVSLQKIRRSIASLLTYLPNLRQPLSGASIVATGDVVLVFQEGAAFEAITGQEWIFPIASMEREISMRRKRPGPPQPWQVELFPDAETIVARTRNR
jgi:DNA-binding transcriptional MerR regulator